jgi:hypothetical protein
VVLQDAAFTCFSGEWSDPALVVDGHYGEHVLLSALGGGVALRDDPDESVYTTQTAQAIISSEFSKRSAFLAVDADQKLVLPDQPVTTFSPMYDGSNLEEILHDLATDLGDYTWGVWDHTRNKDAAGFPTWQLAMHLRDTSTTHYMALGEDILSWRVTPSAQRAYNVIEVAYIDPSAGAGKVLATDTRLAGNGAQNLAPFRRRKLRRALSNLPMTSGQAQAIANAWLATYQNVTNKVEVELRCVRDANGVVIPLHQVRADKNLYVPQLAVRGEQLASGPVAGVNQFWICETRYRETSAGDVSLVLSLDNYVDRGAYIVAQLQLSMDAARRRRGTYRTVIAPGVVVTANCGANMANQTAGAHIGVAVQFPGEFANTPSNVTLTPVSTANADTPTATGISNRGFTLGWHVPAAGASTWLGTYTTVV